MSFAIQKILHEVFIENCAMLLSSMFYIFLCTQRYAIKTYEGIYGMFDIFSFMFSMSLFMNAPTEMRLRAKNSLASIAELFD